MTTPFVGTHRRVLLEQLADDFAAVSNGEGPLLAFLEAPLGWGKTRIVHELYARLAESQEEPYWPASIVDATPVASGDEVSRRRKALAPAPFLVPRGAVPEWVWLAVATDPSVIARPEEAYRALAEQLEPHLYPILRQQRITKAAARAIVSALAALLPIPQEWDAVQALAGGAIEVAQEWWRGGETRRVGGATDSSGIFWKLLTDVWGHEGDGGPPIVLVIEDAQFLSEPSVEMIGALLASELPVLVVATGWPLKDDDRFAPFRAFVEARPARLRVEHLEELTTDDAREILTTLHPGTADDVTKVLVERFAANPYALQLFLWNRRARRGSPFETDDLDWLASTSSSVHTELSAILERTPLRTRTAVLIASLLGSRFPIEMGDSAVLTHTPDLSILDSLKSDWLRRDRAADSLLTFVEPIRREVASTLARSDLTPRERQTAIDSAMSRLVVLLTDDEEDPDAALLQSLYVELATDATEVNGGLLATCLSELLQAAWRQRAIQRGHWLLNRLTECRQLDGLDEIAIAEMAVAEAKYTRLLVSPAAPVVLDLTLAAITAATAISTERPDLLALALIERSRAFGNKELGIYDLDRARELVDAAEYAVAGVADVPQLVMHSIITRQYGLISQSGNRREAYELARAEADRCAAIPALAGYSRSECLSDMVFYIARIDPNLSLQPNRDLIEGQIAELGSPTHPRVAAMRKDLAVRMLCTYRHDLVPEALAIAEDSYRLVVAASGSRSRAALATLSARGNARRRLAELQWLEGAVEDSLRLAAQAVADAEEVARGRREAQQRDESSVLTRSRIALALAWTGDAGAVDTVRGCLDQRLARGEGHDFAEVLWLARDYRSTLRRHGRDEEAVALAEEFPAAFRDPYPA